MAVYTEVSAEDLAIFITPYQIGEMISFHGINEGVENTNYLVQTDQGYYILTLFEKRVAAADLPFFLGVMDYLSHQGITCPTPLSPEGGSLLGTLCGRPAAIFSFLKGFSVKSIQPHHTKALGFALADLHLKGLGFPQQRANSLSLKGWSDLFTLLKPDCHLIKHSLADEIEAELAYLKSHWPSGLPQGFIHADLFPDNVFFLLDQTLSGLIDFYFSCTDSLVYDVAICLNAWCFEGDGSFNATKAGALLSAYHRVRPLNQAEQKALPILARGACIRFLVTRAYDWVNTPANAVVKRKDPLEYLAKLRFHQTISDITAYGILS